MDLSVPITAQHVDRRRMEAFGRFTNAVATGRMELGELQALHAEIGQRQKELLRLHSSSQREISKYFQSFQPIPCNPATFSDLHLYGGPRIAINHGKLYVGTILDGKRHGKGVIISQKGKIYEGELMLNERNGVGVEIYENGNFYIGGFVGNKREGDGRMVWANHSPQQELSFQYYTGTWKEGEPHGHGLHVTEGWTFVGTFKQGVRNGKGTEICGGSIFQGHYVNNLKEGKGLQLKEGVEYYEGEFRGGNKHGYGKWRCLKTGQQYEGFFQDGKKQGIGVSLRNGLLYRGLFTQDRPNGTGEFISAKSEIKQLNDCRTVTEQVSKRPSVSKPRGQLQSAQFVRSNPLQSTLSQHSSQKIVRPPKMAKLNTSKDKKESEKKEKDSFGTKGKSVELRRTIVSAKVVRVEDNPERHTCSYRHCSCHKWQQNEQEKLKVDEKRILRLFSARKALLKSIV